MRITFDSNAWEKVVAPHDYPNDPKAVELEVVHRAISDGRVSGFICETFATLEAIRKGTRAAYLQRRSLDMAKVSWENVEPNVTTGGARIRGTLEIGGRSEAHPGLHPIAAERFRQAIELGFLLLPTARFGTARPIEIDHEDYRIPLTEDQRGDIWGFLGQLAAVTQAIENRGTGFAVIEAIAHRILQRDELPSEPWYSGLNNPVDLDESRAIDRAFAEWADGDTVAVHIAYGLDMLCTEDQGKSVHQSVFNAENRAWLENTYELKFIDIEGLAKLLT